MTKVLFKNLAIIFFWPNIKSGWGRSSSALFSSFSLSLFSSPSLLRSRRSKFEDELRFSKILWKWWKNIFPRSCENDGKISSFLSVLLLWLLCAPGCPYFPRHLHLCHCTGIKWNLILNNEGYNIPCVLDANIPKVLTERICCFKLSINAHYGHVRFEQEKNITGNPSYDS